MPLMTSLLKSTSARVLACVAAMTGGAVVYTDGDVLDIGNAALSRVYKLPTNYDSHRDQQQMFSTADGQIAFTDHSASSDPTNTILLLHGVPTSSWMYRKIIPQLQSQMRVISIDLLGYGSSDKPKTKPELYQSESQAERAMALMAHLNIDEYSVLMHDMGGLVAWEMLRQQAPIKDLVVLNTIVRQQGFNHPDFDRGSFTKMMMKAYSNNLSSSMMLQSTFEELGLDASNPLSEAECNGYTTPIQEGSDVALYEFFTGINDSLFARLESNAEYFEKFNGRTLVLWGAEDSILTTEQIPFLQNHLRIDERNIQIFNDANHFLAEEVPEKIVDSMMEFFSEPLN